MQQRHLFTQLPASFYTEMKRGIKTAIPITLGFIPFALVLGAQATQKELTPLNIFFMTSLNFGGGSEFAAIELWQNTPPFLLIVMVTLLINSRHILMGATLAIYLKHIPKKRILPALFFMCDESWAIALTDSQQRGLSNQIPSFSFTYYLSVALCLYITWIIFPVIGALIGPQMGDIKQYGFDMAFTAVFLILLKGMWKGMIAARPWLVSLIVAALIYLMFPTGAWHVAAGTIAGLLYSYYYGEKHVRS